MSKLNLCICNLVVSQKVVEGEGGFMLQHMLSKFELIVVHSQTRRNWYSTSNLQIVSQGDLSILSNWKRTTSIVQLGLQHGMEWLHCVSFTLAVAMNFVLLPANNCIWLTFFSCMAAGNIWLVIVVLAAFHDSWTRRLTSHIADTQLPQASSAEIKRLLIYFPTKQAKTWAMNSFILACSVLVHWE